MDKIYKITDSEELDARGKLLNDYGHIVTEMNETAELIELHSKYSSFTPTEIFTEEELEDAKEAIEILKDGANRIWQFVTYIQKNKR